jgi:hypothetical protein
MATVKQHIPKTLPDGMRNQAIFNDPAIDKKELPVSLRAIITGLSHPATQAERAALLIYN